MIELKITGEDAYEFSTQVATIATIFDMGSHPWDYQPVLEMIQKQHEHTAQMQAVKEKAAAGVASGNTIEPDHHNYPVPEQVVKELQKPAEQPATNVSIAGDPVPAAQADTVKDYISHEDLQRKCVDLGDAYGQAVFAELKKQAGFVSMKKLDPAGRQAFADLIDQYIADHPKG